MRLSCLRFANSLRLSFLLTLLLCATFLSGPYAEALAQSAHTAKLVEGAKKEGKFTWYTPASVPDAEALIKAFR